MGGAMTATAFKLDKYVSGAPRGSVIGIATVVLFDLLVVDIELHRKDKAHWVQLPRGCRWLDRRIASRFNTRALKELMTVRPELFRHPPGPAPAPLLETFLRSAKGGNRNGQEQR
jgi:hypothetical protein